jgi:hypothetical protein
MQLQKFKIAIMKRTDIINEIIEKFNYKSYLEIGVCNPNRNFNKIDAKIKIGVDPDPSSNANNVMTSDDFFKINKKKFDLIFIDGLHLKKQVIKDIHNSLECLSKNGTIVMHDCNPPKKEMQIVPRCTKLWNGDVWKAFVLFRSKYKNLNMFVIDTDYGVGIIREGNQYLITIPKKLTFENFDIHRKKWLNLIDKSIYKNYL